MGLKTLTSAMAMQCSTSLAIRPELDVMWVVDKPLDDGYSYIYISEKWTSQ